MSGWLAICLICFLCGWVAKGLCGYAPRLRSAWHRICVMKWRWISRPRGGRPRISRKLIALIHRLCAQNPGWGAPRIHGELLHLGFNLAEATVSKYMIPRAERPTPGWKTFLRNHAADIVAIDMLTVWTLGMDRLYAVVILGHARRRILHVEVTSHPTALWLAGQITEAFPWDEAPRFIVRDNDGAYGLKFRRRLKAMGIKDRPTMPRSPWQNGYVERVIGSIRRECLDHIIPINAAHLRRLLKEYVEYYNNDRTHLGLAKDTPISRAVEREGRIVSRPVLGGLHHRYSREPPK